MIHFIVNPVAGSGKSKRAAPIIENVMKSSGREYRLVYTNKPHDAETVANAISFDKTEAIVCVGGDGTIQEIMPHLLNAGIPMGIIPAGSGNDFAASLPGFKIAKGSFEQRIEAYTHNLLNGKTRMADAISVKAVPKDGEEAEELFFLNIGSTGMDAEVVASTLKIKKFFGGAAYFVSLLKTLFTYSSQKINITADGAAIENKYLLIAICNGSFYGGGFNICPAAKIDDGYITLCAVTHLSRLKVMALFPSVLFGKHTSFKEVSQTNCRELALEFEGSRLINLDGNLFHFKSPIEFMILKSALKLMV